MLDIEDNDEGNNLYNAAEAEGFSWDGDEVLLAAIVQKSQAGGKGTKTKMTSKGSKTVSASFVYIDDMS
jgi:hypothetical protein